MTWINVTVQVAPEFQEIALAFLSEFPFNAFEETEAGLQAYIEEEHWTSALQEELSGQNGVYWVGFSGEPMPDQNWNALWESNFNPVDLSPFCVVRAIFHAPRPDVRFDLVIQPERAFGTGHHATTRMMVLAMEDLNLVGSSVLDFGAGTAILGILAAKLGATRVDAVEIEGPACISAQSNIVRNEVEDQVTIFEGGLEVVPSVEYDLILANINRNVLLDSIPTLQKHLLPGGQIGISGFLPQDVDILEECIQPFGWQLTQTRNDSGWVSLWWTKPKQV